MVTCRMGRMKTRLRQVMDMVGVVGLLMVLLTACKPPTPPPAPTTSVAVGSYKVSEVKQSLTRGQKELDDAIVVRRKIEIEQIDPAGVDPNADIRRILATGIDPNFDAGGYTPLTAAIGCHDINLVKLLLEHGARVDFKTRLYTLPFEEALSYHGEWLEIADLLVAHGADVYIDPPDAPILSPLASAASRGDVMTVKWLLAHGANPNGRRSDNWNRPLYLAAESGHVEVARVLLRAGADPNLRGGEPEYPITATRSSEVIEELIRGGANIDIGGMNDNSAIHWAAVRGDLPAIKLLLAHGAIPNKKNKDGYTPWAFAQFNVKNKALLQEIGEVLERASATQKAQ
jgi:ankyrin repeat protein